MKKTYIFLLVCCALNTNLRAQTDCSKAYAHIVYALSHAESALASNNKTHAMHFAARSKEAFETVQASLNECQCDGVDDTVYDAINYLGKAKNSRDLNDAYYFANKGKTLAEKTIMQLDQCTEGTSTDMVVTEEPTLQVTNGTEELQSIEAQQAQLLQQQKELERKQAELQQMMAQKKEQEQQLKKQELITKLEATVAQNVKTFNTALQACGCNTQVSGKTSNTQVLMSQSLEAIRQDYIQKVKALSAEYTQKLEACSK